MTEITSKMTRQERQASISLALVFALRMLGLFVLLPIFKLHAQHLPDGDDAFLVGLAFGAYGLTQAFLHIPLGILSDKIGRKPVIIGGLIAFAIGCAIAAEAQTVHELLIARIIQGTGAISAAITACLSDLTRENQRTKAMAMVGGSIGLSFALGFMFAPMLYHWLDMSGIFWSMTVLIMVAIVIVLRLPSPPQSPPSTQMPNTITQQLCAVLKHPELVRFNIGVLILHATLMSMFSLVPSILSQQLKLERDTLSYLYLGVVFSAFVIMMFPLRYGEKTGNIKTVFVGSIGLMLATQLCWGFIPLSFALVAILLLAYFISFNILEASQPSLVSKIAPFALRGAAMGIYNTAQSIGIFVGGALGGLIAKYQGNSSVFIANAILLCIWLIVTMKMPKTIQKQTTHLKNIDTPIH